MSKSGIFNRYIIDPKCITCNEISTFITESYLAINRCSRVYRMRKQWLGKQKEEGKGITQFNGISLFYRETQCTMSVNSDNTGIRIHNSRYPKYHPRALYFEILLSLYASIITRVRYLLNETFYAARTY